MSSRRGDHDDEPRTLVDKSRKRYSGPSGKPRPVKAAGERQALKARNYGTRYVQGDTIGEGAMGEVVLARDRRVGREVAVKRLHADHRDTRPDLQDRFLREARVQGQLEHPAIVPVYDIGMDEQGSPYFTMKRVRGRTLAEILEGLLEGNPEIRRGYSRRRLFTAMSRVCLCVSFAHERGVVHRDLKPANIMLGHYGEVYVLDWGIAQVRGVDETSDEPLNLGKARAHRTEAGFVIGTPGYMAPEQARGERETHGGRSDIYSLGAILFQVATLEHLHTGTNADELLRETIAGVEARPSVRMPHMGLPAELDIICARATALPPEGRYPTARDMNDAIEGVLDGDRDSTRRSQLAAEQVDVARHALEWARRGGHSADGQHRKAVGALMQALALEPGHREARQTLVELLLEPADALPEEAERELKALKENDRVRATRWNVLGIAGFWPIIPLSIWMGVRAPWQLWTLTGTATAVVCFLIWMERTRRVSPRYVVPALIAAFTMIAGNGIYLGSLFVVPGLAVAAATSSMIALRASPGVRLLIQVLCHAAIAIPALLQYHGILPSSYVFQDGQMCIRPGATNLPEGATWVFLIISNMLTAALGTQLVSRSVEAAARTERAMFAQAWRLRQFLPELSPEDAERPLRRSRDATGRTSRRSRDITGG